MQTDNINITFEDKDDLTPYQKIIIQKIYNKGKTVVDEINSVSSASEALSITIAITNLAQLVEHIKINNTPLSGENKKKIVLYLGKKLLIDILPDDKKDSIESLYDIVAEKTLSKLIDFANNNKMVQTVTMEANDMVDDLPPVIKKNCCTIC